MTTTPMRRPAQWDYYAHNLRRVQSGVVSTAPGIRKCRDCGTHFIAILDGVGLPRFVHWCDTCRPVRSHGCRTCRQSYPLDTDEAVTTGQCPVCRVHPTLFGATSDGVS